MHAPRRSLQRLAAAPSCGRALFDYWLYLLSHLVTSFPPALACGAAAGFEQLVASENASPRGRLNGGAMLATAPNERALLGCLLAWLAALDADVLVGHNIGAYEMAVLLGRLQAHKVRTCL
jgi:hypothetical protein